jgi:XTP/dITP diphosphohydrolase
VSPALVVATHNAKKRLELERILAAAGVQVELRSVQDFPNVADVAETGATFAENALLKAHAVASATGLPAVADDSGLTVDALNGMPGIFSARWAGRHGDDQANLDLVLAQTADVPDERRGAAFVCAAALALPDGQERVEQRDVRGHLIRQGRGGGGFGYDPIFVPDGFELTTAELSPADKDAISHRGQAFRAIVEHVRELVAA